MIDTKVFVCRDCRFYHDRKCYHRNAYKFKVVDGKGEQDYASVMRIDVSNDDQCGTQARFFEPRMPNQGMEKISRWWRR